MQLTLNLSPAEIGELDLVCRLVTLSREDLLRLGVNTAVCGAPEFRQLAEAEAQRRIAGEAPRTLQQALEAGG